MLNGEVVVIVWNFSFLSGRGSFFDIFSWDYCMNKTMVQAQECRQ